MDEVYGVELSKTMLLAITDKVIPVVREWQGRQLEEVYPLLWMDAFVIFRSGRKDLFERKAPTAYWQ